jgi:hypothetical protein
MRRVLLTAATITGAAIALAGVAHAAPSVEVRDAVARVTVIPENRPDVKVEVVRANPGLPLRVRQEGGKTVIDGDLKRRIHSCDSDNGQAQVRVGGLGEVSWQDMPQIVIRTPMSVDLGVGGAVFGSVGRTNELSFGSAGCGDWTLANVQGRARLSSAGSGDIRAGSAGEATLRLAGSGDSVAGGRAWRPGRRRGGFGRRRREVRGRQAGRQDRRLRRCRDPRRASHRGLGHGGRFGRPGLRRRGREPERPYRRFGRRPRRSCGRSGEPYGHGIGPGEGRRLNDAGKMIPTGSSGLDRTESFG